VPPGETLPAWPAGSAQAGRGGRTRSVVVSPPQCAVFSRPRPPTWAGHMRATPTSRRLASIKTAGRGLSLFPCSFWSFMSDTTAPTTPTCFPVRKRPKIPPPEFFTDQIESVGRCQSLAPGIKPPRPFEVLNAENLIRNETNSLLIDRGMLECTSGPSALL
jgi:hypothetical protein